MMLVHPNLAWPGERKGGEIVLELRGWRDVGTRAARAVVTGTSPFGSSGHGSNCQPRASAGARQSHRCLCALGTAQSWPNCAHGLGVRWRQVPKPAEITLFSFLLTHFAPSFHQFTAARGWAMALEKALSPLMELCPYYRGLCPHCRVPIASALCPLHWCSAPAALSPCELSTGVKTPQRNP